LPGSPGGKLAVCPHKAPADIVRASREVTEPEPSNNDLAKLCISISTQFEANDGVAIAESHAQNGPPESPMPSFGYFEGDWWNCCRKRWKLHLGQWRRTNDAEHKTGGRIRRPLQTDD